MKYEFNKFDWKAWMKKSGNLRIFQGKLRNSYPEISFGLESLSRKFPWIFQENSKILVSLTETVTRLDEIRGSSEVFGLYKFWIKGLKPIWKRFIEEKRNKKKGRKKGAAVLIRQALRPPQVAGQTGRRSGRWNNLGRPIAGQSSMPSRLGQVSWAGGPTCQRWKHLLHANLSILSIPTEPASPSPVRSCSLCLGRLSPMAACKSKESPL